MKTAQHYREEANRNHQRAQESWERSDTDGFLTQWSCGLSAQLSNTKADIVENGGKAEFVGLYEGSRRVRARIVESQFGPCWLLHESETGLISRRNKRFVPCGENSTIQRKLGLKERMELAPAWAKFEGRGNGLSGTVWVSVFRTGNKWGLDSIPL